MAKKLRSGCGIRTGSLELRGAEHQVRLGVLGAQRIEQLQSRGPLLPPQLGQLLCGPPGKGESLNNAPCPDTFVVAMGVSSAKAFVFCLSNPVTKFAPILPMPGVDARPQIRRARSLAHRQLPWLRHGYAMASFIFRSLFAFLFCVCCKIVGQPEAGGQSTSKDRRGNQGEADHQPWPNTQTKSCLTNIAGSGSSGHHQP